MPNIKNLFLNNEKLLDLCDKRLKVKREKSAKFAEKVISDVRENRNWSWYKELLFRNKDNLDNVALFYRGNEISYRDMFLKMIGYAKSLKTMGVKKGDEIPVCMSNTPEFVYLLGAISMIGASANIFGEDFEKDHILEILDGCNTDLLFIEDNKLLKIDDVVKKSHIKKTIVSSLRDSLPHGQNPYYALDNVHKELFRNKVPEIISNNPDALSISGFEKIGNDYDGELVDDSVTLDDVFTITYSSGTTSKRPKGIMHGAKSFNVVTRFHDSEINHTPSYKMFKMQASIPTYSSTDLISGISDALTQGCRLALEPIYDEDFIIESLMINKPSYLDLTKSHWVKFAKNVLYNPKYSNLELPSLAICFSVGEPTELNEEKLVNLALKKVKAGRDLLHLPLPIVKLSVAGGDCEHGGIFYRLMRHYHNLNPLHKINKEAAGLGIFDAVDVAVLDENGEHCKPYQVGNLVANSEFTMLGYKNNEAATEKFYVKDSDGKVYGDCCADAYQDVFGYIHFMNRKEKGVVSTNEISDSIIRNLSDVLSCEVVESNGFYIAHVELLPGIENPQLSLCKIDQKCCEDLGEDITSKIVYRLHRGINAFKLTHSGKRDKLSLRDEKISQSCLKPVYINGSYKIISVDKYMEMINEEKKGNEK